MYPVLFEIFGRQIGTYGLFMILGAVAAWILVRFLAGKENKDITLVFLICICGGLIGAFLLRPIMRVPEIIMSWERFSQMPLRVFLSFVFGDIVFYGGLIGGAIAMLLFCKHFKIPVLPIADVFAPALAVAHGFGRIGCFMGGCCFGAIGNIPIQLFEAACLFILAAVLIFVYKKTAVKGLTVCLYGLIYSVLRFILEFYRGDIARGIYGWFSTSQYISMVLFVVSIVLLCVFVRKKEIAGQARNDDE